MRWSFAQVYEVVSQLYWAVLGRTLHLGCAACSRNEGSGNKITCVLDLSYTLACAFVPASSALYRILEDTKGCIYGSINIALFYLPIGNLANPSSQGIHQN